MGGSGSDGKGSRPGKNFFDWFANPIGSAVGEIWDIDIDPLSQMLAAQATNTMDMIQGNDPSRLWFGETWLGDIGAGITGEESRLERTSRIGKEEDRATQRESLIKKMSQEYQSSSLLTDDEDGGL